MNSQPVHGSELEKQIEELKEHLQRDETAFSKFTKSRMRLTEIFIQFDSISEQLLTKVEECQKIKILNDQLLEKNAENLRDFDRVFEDFEKVYDEARLAKENADEARKLLRIDQKARANRRHQREKAMLQSQVTSLLRQIEEASTGCEMLESTNEEADLIPVAIQHLVTFKDVKELQQNNQTLLALNSTLKDEFDAKVKSAVAYEKIAMERELESYSEEISEYKKCRQILKEREKHLECLQAERNECLRVIKEYNLLVPVMLDGPKVDFVEASPSSEPSPTQKRSRAARDKYEDWKRRRVQEQEILPTEEDNEDEGDWLPGCVEDVNESITQDLSGVQQDPPASVSFERSPVPAKAVDGPSDTTIPSTSADLKEGPGESME